MSQTTNFYVSWLGNSAFGGSSIRLRDQEPIVFQPTDISGLAVWMDANDNDAVNYNDLLQVSSWSNKGYLGGQFDASGAGIVEYGQVLQNGLNTVSFKEYGFLTGTLTLNFQSRSVFVVVKPNSFPLNAAVPVFSSDTTNFQETFFAKNGTWLWFEGKHPSPFPTNAFETTTDYTGYASMAEFVISTDLSDNWSGINGTFISPTYQSIANYATGSAVYFLGNYFGGSAIQADVDYCEILVYNTALNNGQRQNVESYLRRKWGFVEPPIPPFVPTDISGCYLWLDANNSSNYTLDPSGAVLSWTNLGLSGSAFAQSLGSITPSLPDINNNVVMDFPTQTTLEGSFNFPYNSRTAFVVFENKDDLSNYTYPFANFINSATPGCRQLGFVFDSFSSNYSLAMCQASFNCPASGVIPNSNLPGVPQRLLVIYGCDEFTNSSNTLYYMGGSNINSSTDLGNLFTISPGSNSYTMGATAFDSPPFSIGEIIEYNSLLPTAQISTVAGYLVNKWNIQFFTPLS